MEVERWPRAPGVSIGKTEGKDTSRPGFCVEEKDPAHLRENWRTGVGWHTFRHTVGTMLAEMGEHQLMIRDYLRHVTNKYLQATTKSKRVA